MVPHGITAPSCLAYPKRVHEVVTEIAHQNQSEAFFAAWRALQSKDGAVWHRPCNSVLHEIAAVLEPVLPQLPQHASFFGFNSLGQQEFGINEIIRGSPITPLLDLKQRAALYREMILMHAMVTTISNCDRCYVDLRIEHTKPLIEHFHRDGGTALLTTVIGPGTQFITHDNLPADTSQRFYRDDLPHPEDVHEVAPRDLLFMRGLPDPSRKLRRNEPSGLWHSSPPKTWRNQEQWRSRILIVATTPESRIVPLMPKFSTW